MPNLLIESETEKSLESRVVHFGERPIPFDRFLDMAEDRFVDLVHGVIVEKPMVQLDHELCAGWLYQVIGPYAQKRGLGQMLSSRIMVKTETFGGRMPDLLFVKQEHMGIVRQRAVYGAPDLVIEVVSVNDRPSDLRALEADYFGLSVPELTFIDLRKQEIRLLRLLEDGYAETVISEGSVAFAALPNMVLQADWIMREPRPDVFDTLTALLSR